MNPKTTNNEVASFSISGTVQYFLFVIYACICKLQFAAATQDEMDKWVSVLNAEALKIPGKLEND